MNNWSNFNNAEEQTEFDIIPKGEIVKVLMSIRPGGYNAPNQGWDGGYATLSDQTGAVYLDCEFVVTEGKYAKRKVWSMIGLHSEKGPKWAAMGRAFVKGILNSARGIQPSDNSPQAQQARCIAGFQDLDNIEFLAKIGIEKDGYGEDKNTITVAITPAHKEYAAFFNNNSAPASAAPQQQINQTTPQMQQQSPTHQSAASTTAKPAWAS